MDVDEVAVPDPQTVWDSIVIEAKRDITVQGLVDWFKDNKGLTLEGWVFTGKDKKADSTPLSSRLALKVCGSGETKGKGVDSRNYSFCFQIPTQHNTI